MCSVCCGERFSHHDTFEAFNEDYRRSVWEAVDRLALEERKRTDQKFVRMDKFIQDRFQRQDNGLGGAQVH